MENNAHFSFNFKIQKTVYNVLGLVSTAANSFFVNSYESTADDPYQTHLINFKLRLKQIREMKPFYIFSMWVTGFEYMFKSW